MILQPKKPFRETHILQVLESFDESKMPLDRHLSFYFKSHKALGSKDRLEIGETIFQLIRWKPLLDAKEPNPSWEKRLKTLPSLESLKNDLSISLAQRSGASEEIFQLFAESLGEAKAHELLLLLNEKAPTTIRVNPLKITRDELLKRFENLPCKPCGMSPLGITFFKREPLFALPEYKEGFFELQDEGSQLLAALVAAKPKQHVLDFCAGSGGKSLAIAPLLEKSGQIYLHDIRPWILQEAKKRLKRAGIENAQCVEPNSNGLKRLKKRMDWILVDVPCSGTGSWRRHPDMKERFSKKELFHLVGLQRTIFEQALSFLKPGGTIVYATCSLLPQENEAQVAHFLKTYPLTLVEEPLKISLTSGGCDAFFGCALTHSEGKKPVAE